MANTYKRYEIVQGLKGHIVDNNIKFLGTSAIFRIKDFAKKIVKEFAKKRGYEIEIDDKTLPEGYTQCILKKSLKKPIIISLILFLIMLTGLIYILFF